MRFYREQWNIGIIRQPIYEFLEPDSRVENIQWAPFSENYKYVADCFGVADTSGITILCEEFAYRSGKAVISSIRYTDEGGFSSPRSAVNPPYHISYPYLFQHDGETYCVPETAAAREIQIHRAKRFPDDWVKVSTILTDVAAVDPTMIKHEDFWWLFFTDLSKGKDTDLFIWLAPSLFGPWKPHLGNPVKCDVRSSRSAGTPFVHAGQLYRPAQDCSEAYGGRVVLNRVTHLTPEVFKEEPVRFIEPVPNSPFPKGLHTLSSVGGFTLVDGKRYLFNPTKAIRLLFGSANIGK
jgi:hypothetical protein